MTNHNPSVCARTVPIWLAVAALAAGCHKAAPAGQLVRTDPNVRIIPPAGFRFFPTCAKRSRRTTFEVEAWIGFQALEQTNELGKT